MLVAMLATIFLIVVGTLLRNCVIDCVPFQVNVDTDGSYTILVNDNVWLTSGDTAFNADGQTYSTADGSLVLIASTTSSGTDELASWTSTSFIYLAGFHPINTTIKIYTDPEIPAVVFTQTYLQPVSKTSAGSTQKVISKFPSFKLQPSVTDLGFLAYGGNMAGYDTTIGRFQESAIFRIGLAGGPFVLFDNTSNALVVSPLTEFMAASNELEPLQQVSWGILGLVDDVPLGYSLDFIVYYSDKGINQAIKSWGNYLTTFYQKTPERRDNDLTIQYLGYWTDNGAYYYYNTEKNKTYENTILDTVDYINSLNIPFRYLQYDSWWYLKGSHQGTKTWLPQSNIFPDGFKYVSERTQLPIGCHNRFWDNETTYAKYNGGQYNFIPDPKSGYAVPDDYNLWHDLFNITQTWGKFILYEQDWLDVETDNNVALQNDLFRGQRWLLQMGEAAEYFGINIQYCMSYSRHLLQSLQIPVVTQARASNDYNPGGHQWNIGITSMFTDALYIAPFKDTFWSTESQPGDPYKKTEPHTRLQSLIATISTGPVGPGDGIGFINKELIMKCCDASGLILKPAKPATAINDQIKRSAFGDSYAGPVGQVYSTYTVISGMFFGIVVAAEVTNDYALTPASAWPNIQFPVSVAFSASNPQTLVSFSDAAPIRLGKNCTARDFCLYYTSPLLTTDVGESFALLGEVEKWVPMSQRRVNDIQTTGDDFLVQIIVQAKETVTFTYFVLSKRQLTTVVCNNSQSSTPAVSSVISLAKGTCLVA